MNGNNDVYDNINKLINNGLANGNNVSIDNGLNGRSRINGNNGGRRNSAGLLDLIGLNGNGNGLLNGNRPVNGNGLGNNGNGLLNDNLNGNRPVNGNRLGNGLLNGNRPVNGNDDVVTILPYPPVVIEDDVLDNGLINNDELQFTGIPKSFKKVLKGNNKLFSMTIPGNVTDLMLNGQVYYKTKCNKKNDQLVPVKIVIYYGIKDDNGKVIAENRRVRDTIITGGESNNAIDLAEIFSIDKSDNEKNLEFGILSVKDKSSGSELLHRNGCRTVCNAYAYVE